MFFKCGVFRIAMSRRSVPGAELDALDEVIRVRVNIEWKVGEADAGAHSYTIHNK